MNNESYHILDEEEGVDEAKLDDGRFGLNDPEQPVVKAAAFSKLSAIEPSGVSDPQNGGQIFVSTGARIAFRKTFPDWSKVRNKLLNKAIATAFAKGEPHQYFKPKKGSGSEVGEVRLFGTTKFIGIIFGSDIRIISVKGNLPAIGNPPKNVDEDMPSSIKNKMDSSGWEVANVGDALKGK